jgi:serine/threonine protein kinase
MIYCINPECGGDRSNQNSDMPCRHCGNTLRLGDKGQFEILEIIKSDPAHPWEVFKVIDNEAQPAERYKVLKTLKKSSSMRKSYLDSLEQLFAKEKQSLDNFRNSGIPKYKIDFLMPLNGTELELDCIVMEFIDGDDLIKRVGDYGKLKNRVEAIRWLKNITEILEYIHDKDYVHRDIKPDNIILKTNQKLALIDFGTVGKVNESIHREGSFTKVLCEPYTAPEQSKNGHQYYKQSDFFALGKTFIYLLTGREPLSGRMELDQWQHDTELLDTESLNDGIFSLLDWLMKDDYRDRPKTTEDIIKVIEYISNKENGVFPNAADTKRFIKNINLPIKRPGEDEPRYQHQLIIWILIAASIGAAIWMVLAYLFHYPPFNITSRQDGSSTPPSISPSPKHSQDVLISFGDLHKIGNYPRDINLQKQLDEGIDLFNGNNYLAAYKKFYQLWQLEQNQKNQKPTDPILLIYMNNAKVRYWDSKLLAERKIHTKINTVVLAAPINDIKGKNRGKKMLYGVAHAQNQVVQERSQLTDAEAKVEPTVYLEIGIVDDDNDPKKAYEVADQIKDLNIPNSDGTKRQVITVIGHNTSETTCKALPVYATAGLPIISPTSSMDMSQCTPDGQSIFFQTNSSTKPGGQKVFFRTNSSTKLESKSLFDLLVARKIDNLKITAFYKKDKPGEIQGFSQDLFVKFKTQYEKKFNSKLEGFDLSIKDNNRSELDLGIKDMQTANVILLFPNGNTQDGANTFESSKEVMDAANRIKNDNPNQIKLILASNPLLTQIFDKDKFTGWENKFAIAVDWHRECGKLVNYNFITEEKNLWGSNDLDRITAQSYEAGQVISTILSKGISERSSILTNLPKLEQFKIESQVFNDKRYITFALNGDRKDIENRIVLTPKIMSEKLKFVLIDNNQCH